MGTKREYSTVHIYYLWSSGFRPIFRCSPHLLTWLPAFDTIFDTTESKVHYSIFTMKNCLQRNQKSALLFFKGLSRSLSWKKNGMTLWSMGPIIYFIKGTYLSIHNQTGMLWSAFFWFRCQAIQCTYIILQ